MNQSRDWPYWLVGLLLGAAAGYVQVQVQDPTISALMVGAFAMFLAIMRPARPWRWGLLVALCLPAAELLAFLSREKPTRGAVIGSFAGLAPALVCAIGGSFLRRLTGELFKKA
jgi:predicted branched-subunit amino acid permease